MPSASIKQENPIKIFLPKIDKNLLKKFILINHYTVKKNT